MTEETRLTPTVRDQLPYYFEVRWDSGISLDVKSPYDDPYRREFFAVEEEAFDFANKLKLTCPGEILRSFPEISVIVRRPV